MKEQKQLADGSWVDIDTPTRNGKNGRVILTPEELAQENARNNVAELEKQKYEAEEKYKDQRRAELAPLDGEGMDAIRKAIEQLAGFLVTDLPPEYEAYDAKVAEIKGRHPKPVK